MIASACFERFDVKGRDELPLGTYRFEVERAREVVIGPAAIQHLLDRDRSRDVRQTSHVIGVKVRDENVIESTRMDTLDIARDPFARSMRAVGSWRCAPDAGCGAGVDEQARPVGKDEKRRVPAPRADVVDVEVAFAPGSQDLKE